MKIKILNNFRCVKCGGMKYVGDPYYAMQRHWVDITCIKCSHSSDIELKKLNRILKALNFKEICSLIPSQNFSKQKNKSI